jgi:hypothetical protein
MKLTFLFSVVIQTSFLFACPDSAESHPLVRREILQKALLVCLLVASAFAIWSWCRPYEWRSDPAAHCAIEDVLLTPDQSFFWLEVHVKLIAGHSHDMTKPVLLESATGKSFAPAGTTFVSPDNQPPNEIWFKFWLEAPELAGPLNLRINDGQLTVKSTSAVPVLGTDAYRNYTTHRW